MTRKLTFLILALFALIAGPGWGQSKGNGDSYELVTSAPTDWSGTYLFAYVNGTSAYVYNGTDSGANNGVSATISSNTISFDEGMVEIEIASMTGGYSLKVIGGTNNGKYLSGGTSNGTTFNTNAVANSLSMNTDGTVKINNNTTTSFQFNSASDQQRFRYFKSAQKGVKLYKKQSTPSTNFTVTYNANDATSGTVPVDENEYESSASVTVLGNTGNLARTNYTFGGWNTQADGEGTTYQAGNTFEISANTTLYAKWIADPKYNLTYKANGGVGEDVVEQYFNNEAVTISNCTFTYEGHRFVNWNTAADGTGTSYEIGATYTMTTAGLTLYAQWEELSVWATTYTSNVTLSTTGGTSANAAKVIIAEEEYTAIKAGTGSAAGAMILTAPQGTTTLHVHAVGWNNETVVLSIKKGETEISTQNLISDSGILGNSPFTINGNAADYYFTIDVSAYTSENAVITFSAASGNRFVIFGVNAEITQAPVATPTFNPTSGSYNINQTVEITCDDEATIYYTTDGNIPTTSSDQYTQAITLTIPGTITIKAIAVNANGSSHVGSATYVITRTQYTPAQLLEEIPTPDDENHTVVFENNIITKLVNNGFYLSINTENDFYVYCTNRPSEWEVGGKVSGTIVGKWTTYNSNNEFCPSNYDNFQYTAPAKYTISFSTNGVAETATIVINQGAEIGSTLPEPTATNVPNGYTFRGWNANEVALTNDEPTYITAETIPTGDMTLYAVFAIAETVEEVGQKTFVLTEDDFNGTSYDANNGSHTKDGITYTSNQVMKQSDVIQFQSGKGYIYNVTAMKVTSISITKTAGTFTVYEGSEEHPTETITNNESGGYTFKNESDRYFSICVGSATGKVSNITVTYEGVTSSTTYSNFCTSVTALSGNLAEAITEANTAYYISDESNVPANTTATINGVLGNADASLLVINDGGQLIHHNAGVAATFQKNITAYADAEGNDGYYLIANPTDNETVANLVNAEGYDLYTFDGAAELEWINMKSSPVVANDGIGYLYANSANVILGFAGEIIPAGSTDINLNYANKEFGGFNLIGNPFACNAYVGKSFYVIDGSELVLSENNYVAPCEGFFVEATEAGQSATISTTDPEAPSALSLTVSQNRGNVIDRAIVNFNGSNNLHKFMMNPAHTNLSIAKGGETFAAISTEAEGELPVNFKAEKNGTYTITVNTKNVDAEYLHLIDNMTGMDVDLLSTPSYTFEAKTSDYASRFKLVFGVKNEASENSDSNFAFMSNGNLVIDNIEGEATLQIVDELGRVISTETVSGSYNKVLNLKAGLYIINLNGMTQKIVVK